MLVKRNTAPKQVIEHMKGGEGCFVLEHILAAEQLGAAGRLFALGTLNKGCSVGMHTHENDMEICYCIAGRGIVTEENGREQPFEPGDANIVPSGCSHEIRNPGEEPLQYLAIVLYPNQTK